MREERPTPLRQALLQRYFRALEEGDVVALAAILHEAEHDEALERSLLALNDLYQHETVSGAQSDSAWIAVEAALQEHGLWPSQEGQDRREAAMTELPGTPARFSGVPSEKSVKLGQSPRRDTFASETFDGATSVSVSSGSQGQSATTWPSVLAAAVVVLLLIGFIAVMTMRVQIDQGGMGGSASAVTSSVTSSVTRSVTSTNTSAQDDNGIVLVGSNGLIAALQAKDGSVIWQIKATMPTHITSSENYVMNVEVQSGVVYFTLEGGEVFAVHESDGRTIWRKSLGINLQPRLYVGNGLVVVWGPDGATALRASDGTQLWLRRDSIPIGVAQGIVFIDAQGANPRVAALDDRTGKTLWMYDTTGGGVSVSADSKIVYVFVSGTYEPVTVGVAPLITPPYLVALRLSDGSLLWRTTNPHDDDIDTHIVIGAEDIYVQTQNSYVCTYRRADGTRTSCTGALNYGQPMAIVNGTVYIADNVQVGSALALHVGNLDAASGRIEWLWQLPTTANGYGDVQIHGNVVVGLGAMGVSAFRLSDGQPLWHALDGKQIDGPLTITTLP